MDKFRIDKMVDQKIQQSLNEGQDIETIKSDLLTRIKNFRNVIIKDGIDPDLLWSMEFQDIPQIRHRYGITYIKQCFKRLADLQWIIQNERKLSKFSKKKSFELILFKEKMRTDTPL
jgi:hypothetical protein